MKKPPIPKRVAGLELPTNKTSKVILTALILGVITYFIYKRIKKDE